MSEEQEKVIDPREEFVEVIEKWQHFWMNQRQNSEADYQNYFHRAFGIDANMRYHLARMLVEHERARSSARMERAMKLLMIAKLAMEAKHSEYQDSGDTSLEQFASQWLAELEELRK